jgi:hypothetical protein
MPLAHEGYDGMPQEPEAHGASACEDAPVATAAENVENFFVWFLE